MFDAQASVEFGELFINELSAIVGYDSMSDSIATYDVLPHKQLDLLCCDCGQ